jgi:hypothetical protein
MEIAKHRLTSHELQNVYVFANHYGCRMNEGINVAGDTAETGGYTTFMQGIKKLGEITGNGYGVRHETI